MKKIILLIAFTISSSNLLSQKDTKILVTINDNEFSVADFKKVYEKNLDAIDNEESKNLDKNLDLYVNYKLKVKQAYDLKLDTLKSYMIEIETYKTQLIAPYLQDKEYLTSLIKEAYDRTKTEIRASHILVRLPKNYTSKDTLSSFLKIQKARQRVLSGESFAKVAKEVSEDPSVAVNAGDLGYFSAFKMLYDFEDAAYSTPNGGVSGIFKTRYGYHFLQNNGTRTSKGERQVAHILISDTTLTGKNKINEVYAKLKQGVYFNKLSQQYSNDGNTKNKGGVLPRFGSGRMVKPFENAAFSLDTIGEYSKPFKTKYGWHIVKLLKQYPILPFNEMEKVISDKVRNSGRAKLSDNAVLNRLKKEYSITVTESSKKLLQRKDLRNLSTDSLKNTLLTINDKILLQSDFVSYVKNQRLASFDDMMEKFIDAEILTYFKENLVNTDSNFAYTLSEYEDGLLLFELMQQKIWNKSSDTIALKNYFKSRKSLYNSDDLKSIKGKVMNDFQLYLDQEWIGQLRSENDVKINRKVLKKIKSYYRKES